MWCWLLLVTAEPDRAMVAHHEPGFVVIIGIQPVSIIGVATIAMVLSMMFKYEHVPTIVSAIGLPTIWQASC